MIVPKALRGLAPERLRDDVRVRAIAVGAGLIPPRTMHSERDAAVLRASRRDAAPRVVEISVSRGLLGRGALPGAGARCRAHLIDPFGAHAWALPAGWGATEGATKRVVARAARRNDGPVLAPFWPNSNGCKFLEVEQISFKRTLQPSPVLRPYLRTAVSESSILGAAG